MAEKSFRTPLGRARNIGTAGYGTEHMLRLRLTAAALMPLAIGFVIVVLTLLHKDYNGARAELGHPLPAIIVLLFVCTGLYHMNLGVRAIVVDYVHGAAREWSLIVNTCVAAALALACVYAVLRIGFV
jgi:succinate dehydrogenase / fumarate reductase membrane anchor subunit